MDDAAGGGEPPTRRLVGRYEIIRQVGRGGMATVYLARQPSLERNVALKELSTFHATSPEMVQRFLRESRLAGSLNHPNIVTVLEYFEDGGLPFIAMEYVPRGSLRPYVGRLSFAQVAGVLEGVLAGLAHAETLGIVHRDLKPENLMVTGDGRVKITDFGIARATLSAGAGGFLTATGTTVGTPSYMAPEQAMGQEVGMWTDLYSVGIMAWEHVVGRVPFADGAAPMVVLMRQVNEAVPPAREVNPDVDPDLSDWIDRLLVKDPNARMRSPSVAWEQLEEIVISKLGPRWRREARLPSQTTLLQTTPPPLTPAPFESQKARTPDPLKSASPSEVDDSAGSKGLSEATAAADSAAPAEAQSSGYLTVGPDWRPQSSQAGTPPQEAPVQKLGEPLVVEEPPTVEEPPKVEEPPGVDSPPPVEEPPGVDSPPPVEARPSPEEGRGTSEQERAYHTFSEAPAGAEPMPVPTFPSPSGETSVEQAPPAPAPRAGGSEPPTATPPIATPPTATPPTATPPAAVPDETDEEPAATAPAPSARESPTTATRGAPEARGRISNRVLLVAGAGLAILAALVGFVIAPSSRRSSPSAGLPLTQTDVSGPIQVSYPSTWVRLSPPTMSYLPLANGLALAPASGGGELVLGTTSSSDPSLLPARLIAALPSVPAPQVVPLAAVHVYRYLDLLPRGATAPVTVYAAPTNAGSLLGACRLDNAATTFAATCERVLGSVHLNGLRILSLGPQPALAAQISHIVTALNVSVSRGGADLRAAKAPAGQAAAARAVAAAYGQAASAVSALDSDPSASPALRQLSAALRDEGKAYTSLATAADHHDGKAYAQARQQVSVNQGPIGSAFAALGRLGYRTTS